MLQITAPRIQQNWFRYIARRSRAFSDEVDTGSSKKMRPNQRARAPIRFHRIEKCSRTPKIRAWFQSRSSPFITLHCSDASSMRRHKCFAAEALGRMAPIATTIAPTHVGYRCFRVFGFGLQGRGKSIVGVHHHMSAREREPHSYEILHNGPPNYFTGRINPGLYRRQLTHADTRSGPHHPHAGTCMGQRKEDSRSTHDPRSR